MSKHVQCFRHSVTIPIGSMSESDFSLMHTSIIDLFDQTCEDYIFQLERGEEEDKLHYQCYVRLIDKLRSRTLAVDWNCHFPGNTCSPASKKGNLALKNYVMKPETRVAGPWGKRPIYTGHDLNCMKHPNPFQQQVLDILATTPNDRTIHYLHEPSGGCGKSKLVKFLCYNNKAKRIPMGNAVQLKTFICQVGAASAYLIDIPRTTGAIEQLADLYSAIEEVKNGFVQSAMYGKVHQLYMEPPHILVFSNAKPKVARLSLDKWKIGTIDKDVFGQWHIVWHKHSEYKVKYKKRKIVQVSQVSQK